MAGLSYNDLVTNIRSYSETDSNVLTTAVLENIILNSQYRIFRDASNVANLPAATINASEGYTITKVSANIYTFNSGVTASVTLKGGGDIASAGPVTVTA